MVSLLNQYVDRVAVPGENEAGRALVDEVDVAGLVALGVDVLVGVEVQHLQHGHDPLHEVQLLAPEEVDLLHDVLVHLLG